MRVIAIFSFLVLLNGCFGTAGAPTDDRLPQVDSNETQIDWQNISSFGSVTWAGPSAIWAVNKRKKELIRSKDAGTSWDTVQVVGSAVGARLVYFLDENSGWLVDLKNALFFTGDAGTTWTELTKPNVFANPTQLKFEDLKSGWVWDYNILWRTSDGGISWSESTLPHGSRSLDPGNLFILDSIHLFVCDYAEQQGLVQISADSGLSWQSVSIPADPRPPCQVLFPDPQNGFVHFGALGGANIMRTTDGGRSWSLTPQLPRNFELRSMVWFTVKSGLLAGSDSNESPSSARSGAGIIYRTTDGGQTWSRIPLPVEDPFFDQFILLNSTKVLLTSRDSILFSADSGNSWKLLYTASR